MNEDCLKIDERPDRHKINLSYLTTKDSLLFILILGTIHWFFFWIVGKTIWIVFFFLLSVFLGLLEKIKVEVDSKKVLVKKEWFF